MKINLKETHYIYSEREVECERYVRVPGWVWPFPCDFCYNDIKEDGEQVIVSVDGDIKHYHVRCFEDIQVR